MDILEFAFYAGMVGFILAGAAYEMTKIMWKEWKKWRRNRLKLRR